MAEKRGIIKVFNSLTDPSPRVFADLRTQVYNFWDRGLLGLALSPTFPTDPHLYVLYTANADIGGTAPKWVANPPDPDADPCPNPPGATTAGCTASGRLSRLTMGSNGLQSGSEQVLINDWCQQFPSHSVGTVTFGPDGYLYAGGGEAANFSATDYGQFGTPKNPCGDPPTGPGTTLSPPTAEGGSLRAQDMLTPSDPTTLDGSIIRVDPATGDPAPGNPTTTGDINAKRIISYGFRNPYRFTFRPGTSEIWAGDVGADTVEEINRITSPTGSPPADFGWPCYEGAAKQPGFNGAGLDLCNQLYASGKAAAPYFSYKHSDHVATGESCPTGSSSITGDTFYTGGSYPAAYAGSFFFADYARNCIWSMKAKADGTPDTATVAIFDDGASSPVDLQTGPGGDLFYADLTGGAIHQISYPTGVQSPTARITADKTTGAAPLAVHLDGGTSSDPAPGEVLTYAWDLNNDGRYDDATGVAVDHTFPVGDQTVRLQVTNTHGKQGVTSIVIHSGNTEPVPVIDTPVSGTTWKVGDAITFSGHATDTQDGTEPASRLSWDFVLYHCPNGVCHTHPVTAASGVASGSFPAPDHSYPSHLQLRLTATDANGLTKTVTRDLDPQTATMTFDTSPTGLSVVVGSTSHTTPYSATVITGSTNSISTDSPQAIGTRSYLFDSWSDGLPRAHDVVVNASTTYLATFHFDNNNPVPTIDTPAQSATWSVGSPLAFSGSATDHEDGTLAASALSWVVVLHRCPGGTCRDDVIATASGASGSVTPPNVDLPAYIELRLTATDSNGGSATVTRQLQPAVVPLSMDSTPSGVTISVAGGSVVTAGSINVIKGSSPLVTAPSAVRVGGVNYQFSSWSDGGARAHSVAASGPASRTASYTPVATGYLLDSFGKITAVNGATPAGSGPTFGFAIARRMTLLPSKTGGYVLDGYGGAHPWAVSGSAAPVALSGLPYWGGWDIARDIVMLTPTSGYVLDGWGGLHPFGSAPAVSGAAYWNGWDIARKVVLEPDGSGGFVLDGWGGLHPFAIGSNPVPTAPSTTAYWSGWDIARSLALSGPGRGYVLDGWGGVHPFGGAPAASPTRYSSGSDEARALAVTEVDGDGGSVADAFGRVSAFGDATAIARPLQLTQPNVRDMALTTS